MNAPATQSLYSRDVLRLAMALPHDDRLAKPTGSATLRAPLCGSEMTAEVALQAGTISEIAIRAKACALGQASAAIMREIAIGQTAADIAALRADVEAALEGVGEMPEPLAALAYALDYPARHGAILLPFDTLLAAIEGAGH